MQLDFNKQNHMIYTFESSPRLSIDKSVKLFELVEDLVSVVVDVFTIDLGDDGDSEDKELSAMEKIEDDI